MFKPHWSGVAPHIYNEYEGVVDTIVQLFVSGIFDVMRLL